MEPSNEPYDDLESVTWAKDSILSLTEKGIVSGDGNKKFRPNDNIKREEFLKIALEAFNLVSDGAVCELDDVADNAWYYKYVASGMEKELVNGVDERHFGVGSEITRQDMATLAYMQELTFRAVTELRFLTKLKLEVMQKKQLRQ